MRSASESGRALPATMMCSASSSRGQAIVFFFCSPKRKATSIDVSRPGAADLPVALERVAVAEIEERARVEHGQVHRRALPDVRGVHVAAERPRPQAVERLVTLRRCGHPPEHRPQRHRDRLDARCPAGRRYPSSRWRSMPPHVTAARERLVQERRALVGDERAEAAALRGHRGVAVRPHLQHLDHERIARLGALDGDRPHLAGPLAARASRTTRPTATRSPRRRRAAR